MLRVDGKRIYLRDHQAGDLDMYHAWISDPAVMHFLSWRTTTRDESLVRLAEAILEKDKIPRTRYYLAVVLHEDECIIGEAGFTVLSRGETGGIAEIGYFLLPEYWGKGYASEATELMIGYCFTELGLHKVMATCDAENRASESVMKKCGMLREAYRRQQSLLDGRWRDRLEYAIFHEDWIKHQNLYERSVSNRMETTRFSVPMNQEQVNNLLSNIDAMLDETAKAKLFSQLGHDCFYCRHLDQWVDQFAGDAQAFLDNVNIHRQSKFWESLVFAEDKKQLILTGKEVDGCACSYAASDNPPLALCNHCCKSFQQELFTYLLGQPVVVNITASYLLGDKRCSTTIDIL